MTQNREENEGGQPQRPQQLQNESGQQGWDQNQSGQAQQDQLGGRSGQQQGFEAQQSSQPNSGSSGGSDSRFADQIREHQDVVDADGNHVGTVDHVQGDRIKLSRSDSSDGEHHYVQLSQVAGIDGDKVRLRERGDNDFGVQAGN